MAFKGGTNAIFKVGETLADTMTDISAYLKRSSLPRTADTYDTTTFGKTSKVYIPGLKDGTIPIEGPWDPTIDTILGPMLGFATTRNFEYYPHGTGTGNVKYSGAAILRRYEIPDPVDGAVTFTGEFQISDTVTRTVL